MPGSFAAFAPRLSQESRRPARPPARSLGATSSGGRRGRGSPLGSPEGRNQPGSGRDLAASGGASERAIRRVGLPGKSSCPLYGARGAAGPDPERGESGVATGTSRVAWRQSPPSPPLSGQRREGAGSRGEERGVMLPVGALPPALRPCRSWSTETSPRRSRATAGGGGGCRSRVLPGSLPEKAAGSPGRAAVARQGALPGPPSVEAVGGTVSPRLARAAGLTPSRLAGAATRPEEVGLAGPARRCMRQVDAVGGGRFLKTLSHSGGSEEMTPPVAYQKLKTLESSQELLPLAEQPGQTLRQFHGSALGRPCHSASGLRPAEPPSQSTSILSWDFQCMLVTAILSTVLVVVLVVHSFFFPLHGLATLGHVASVPHVDHRCSDSCRSVLVESIPEGLTYDDNSTLGPSTFETWQSLLRNARSSVDIASFYWTLSNQDTHTHDPSASQGEEILTELLHATRRGIVLRIAVNPPSTRMPSTDLQLLEKSGAQIRQVDLPRLTRGVLHTKFWIVDQLHIYLGSANMDWRALTQVKELGAAVYNCSCLAQDLGKMFEAYWILGLPNTTIPSPWPANYSTTYNKETPLELELNGTEAAVYFSSAPPALCATGRTDDLQSLLSIIEGAQEFVYVSVMSYLPTMEFSHPRRFWPAIDDHFRKVAYEKRVRLRLLVGCWRHSKPNMFPFLRSLAALQDNHTHYSLEVRLFVVPANETQGKIPYARVNHSKFMVTDKVAYIGTSNWSGDYFLHTAGSALVVSQRPAGDQATLRKQLQRIFERDWNSRYSRELEPQGQGEPLCSAR